MTRKSQTEDKSPGKALSREQWLCQKRDIVNRELATTPLKKLKPEDVADMWTPEHTKELNFNGKKQLHRVFEGLRSNIIKPEELPEEIVAWATDHFNTTKKNMVDRERRELATQEVVSRDPLSWVELRGLHVHALVAQTLCFRTTTRRLVDRRFATHLDMFP